MISILDLKARSAASVPAKAPAAVPEPVKAEISTEPEESRTAPEEYEFVLGRRQVAGLSFVATVVLMICVAAAYLAGKSSSVKVVTIQAPAQAPAPMAAPVQPAPVVVKPAAPAPVVELPLFATPKQGSVYIQMGAVEKGIAVIFAEGLRKRGLPGFVAPGPSEKIFRVLIGPLPDPASYVKAKSVVDGIGLETFAKRIQD